MPEDINIIKGNGNDVYVNMDNIEVLEDMDNTVPFNENDIPPVDYKQEYEASQEVVQRQAFHIADLESHIQQQNAQLESMENNFDKIVARLVIRLLGDR